MQTGCIVVIGHVDHGKTALVHALTGIKTDNLPEEKSRGLSITPGFAHYAYSNGVLDFIDSPGHEDFIEAMVSGATGARFLLIVISATEGISAQTLEHLQIADLLGIKNGVIAVTKADLLTQTEQAEQTTKIQVELAPTAFRSFPLVLCSALTGHGLDNLHTVLQSLLLLPKVTLSPLHNILPVDRVFSRTGSGTIVTGTLLGQKISIHDEAVMLPEGRRITLRSLQSRGEIRNTINGGERMAANIRGVTKTDIKRGAVLAVGNTITPSPCFDVFIKMLPTSRNSLKHMEEIRVLFGTSNQVAKVRLFGGGGIAKAQFGFAQLRFQKPVISFAGQRVILRRLSPAQTIAGAIILDPNATPVKSNDAIRLKVLKAAQTGDANQIALALTLSKCRIAKISDVARLAQRTARSTRGTLNKSYINLNPEQITTKINADTCKKNILETLTSFHSKNPRRAWASRKVIQTPSVSPILLQHVEDELLASGEIRIKDTMIALSTHDAFALLSQIDRKRLNEIETIFSMANLKSPHNIQAQSAVDIDLIDLLIDKGRLIVLQNISLKQTLIFHVDGLIKATSDLRAAFPASQAFTTGEARTILNTTRKVIVPLLEHFDKIGITVRTGNLRQMVAMNLVSSQSHNY